MIIRETFMGHVTRPRYTTVFAFYIHLFKQLYALYILILSISLWSVTQKIYQV